MMLLGKVVVIFTGLRIPHVLRRTLIRLFILIGEAYCDVVMDGRLFDKVSKRQIFIL